MVKSHRWGREYRYYRCIRDLRRDVSVCPIKEIRAGDIEELVCKQMIPVLKSPEIVAAVSKQTGIRPSDIMNQFDEVFWNELTPIEKQRLIQIMVEQVTINENGVTIIFRTENIKSIQETFNDQQDS